MVYQGVKGLKKGSAMKQEMVPCPCYINASISLKNFNKHFCEFLFFIVAHFVLNWYALRLGFHATATATDSFFFPFFCLALAFHLLWTSIRHKRNKKTKMKTNVIRKLGENPVLIEILGLRNFWSEFLAQFYVFFVVVRLRNLLRKLCFKPLIAINCCGCKNK